MVTEGLQAGMNSSLFARPLDILVLMGGPSAEREVSLLSGEAVACALEGKGHRVVRADIRPDDVSALDGPRPDVVFIALHGAFGEDGQVQRLCEERQLAYVGSPPRASETAMDKAAAKTIYRQAGLDTPDWDVLSVNDEEGRRAAVVEAIGLPCVLKPLGGGSSVDITIARDEATRDQARVDLLEKYGRAMIERFVAGRELTVGVLGRQALPVIEIVPKRSFYDYQAKYFDDDTEYRFEHGLDERTVIVLQQAALRAHHALGCRDLSRSDFLLDDDGNAWVLETNTIPGFTSHSLLPKAAGRVGIEFARLCEELVRMAMDRSQSKVCAK